MNSTQYNILIDLTLIIISVNHDVFSWIFSRISNPKTKLLRNLKNRLNKISTGFNFLLKGGKFHLS